MSGPLDTLRVDQVGSLHRPASLAHLWERHGAGEVSDDELRAAQEAAIRAAVAGQEQHSLPILTDGELGHLQFQDRFANSVAGFDAVPTTVQYLRSRQSAGEAGTKLDVDLERKGPAVMTRRPATERLHVVKNLALRDYAFAQSLTGRPVKVTLVGPDRISQRFAHERSTAYSGLDDFTDHVVALEARMLGEAVAAGCRYVQIDEPGYTAYVDPRSLDQMRSRGEDPTANLARSIRADNALIASLSGATVGLHVCRGNERGRYHREGTYDEMDERVFSELSAQRLLLEYDTERAGSFAPLRHVRPGTIVVLGLISTKSETLETVDVLMRRIDEATRYLPPERLALSPQCGFGGVGNEDLQWRKLDVMLETAARVWG